MGLVKNYKFEQIKPFLLSLKNIGYQGDVCFLVGNLTPETMAAIKEYNVELKTFRELYVQLPVFKEGKISLKKLYYYHKLVNVYPFNRLNYWLVNTLTSGKNPSSVTKAKIASLFVHVMCVRYPLYYLYLTKYGQKYDNIMLTDVRDVIFQRDPFDFDIGDSLCCFYEDEGKTIGSCEVNSTWIKEGFNPQALTKIGHKKISCSGTTIGSRSAIMRYLEVMIDNMIQLKCHTWGIDQGVHNYILQTGLFDNVKFYENQHGPILTMHYTSADKLHFDNQGYLVNDDGSIINALHQYDRQSPEIKNKMRVYRQSVDEI